MGADRRLRLDFLSKPLPSCNSNLLCCHKPAFHLPLCLELLWIGCRFLLHLLLLLLLLLLGIGEIFSCREIGRSPKVLELDGCLSDMPSLDFFQLVLFFGSLHLFYTSPN